MLRKLTQSVCLILALTVARRAGAFTLWGPLDTWQTADLDYSNPPGSPRYFYFYIQATLDGLVSQSGLDGRENGGPKTFGGGSRLTTPIVTYAFDSTFLEFFGTQGEAAVNSAMQVLNALPSASSANLDNFPTDGAEQINYTAEALLLQDLKSTVLWMMAEHLGLMGETHVYDLRVRVIPTGAVACTYNYLTINYNYDPVTYNPSAYVNGRLYTYWDWDGCPAFDVGASVVVPADVGEVGYTAVATGNGIGLGGYYQGMSRDDMGGLKYLYRKNNYAYQALDSESVATSSPTATATTINSPWNPVGSTNGTTTTGSNTFAFTGGVLGGVEKITFVKVQYDSLLGAAFTPITYNYTIPFVTNSRLSQLNVTRTVTVPDIIFTAADMVVGGPPILDPLLSRTGTFIPSPYVSPGGGDTPSTINPSMLIVLNDVGTTYFSVNFAYLDTLNSPQVGFNWGSFDGSTNPPTVYPLGSSLAGLEAEAVQQGAVVGATGLPPTSPWNPAVTTSTGTGTGTTGTGTAPP
jgi:hypothetical protein